MKKISALILTLFVSLSVFSQIIEPVIWDSEVNKIDEDTYELIMHASIDEGWYLYTQDIPDGGPIPTNFTFENENNDFELIGKVEESKSHKKFDKIFEMDLSYFSGTATFTQKIKLLNKEITTLNAAVDFQSCDDEKCIFESAEIEFTISQIFQPVKWASEIKKLDDDTYELKMNANIDDGWYLYTQDEHDDGPIPTSFTFENENNDFELVGKVKESESHSKFDKIFEIDLAYFEGTASFTQK